MELDKFPNRAGYDFSEVDLGQLCSVFESDFVQQRIQSLKERHATDRAEMDLLVEDMENLLIYISEASARKRRLIPKPKDNKVRFSQGFERKYWFDSECKEERKKLVADLRQAKGKSSAEYRSAFTEYRKLLKRKRTQFEDKQLNTLNSLRVDSPKQYWDLLRRGYGNRSQMPNDIPPSK